MSNSRNGILAAGHWIVDCVKRIDHWPEPCTLARIEQQQIANGGFAFNLLSDLERPGIPTVIIGRELESNSTSSVTVDDEGGGYAAVAHLYALGHRKIAFVRGPRALSSSKNRWRGVQRFARYTGLELDPKLIVDLPDQLNPNLGVDDGNRMTMELLSRRRPFTALMAFDDMTAFGAMRAMANAGIKIPSRCSIIGFDDVTPSALFVPSLTTVRQPMEAMGASAVNIIVDAISAGAGFSTV